MHAIRIALQPTVTGRFSRRDVALSGEIWLTLVVTFTLLSAGLFAVVVVTDEFSRVRVSLLAAALAVVSVVLARMRPPEPGSRTVHGVLALVYVAPALALCAFAPQGSAVVATAVFVGPLISVWLEDRRQIAAHLAAATIVLFIPSIIGLTDTGTLVACITLAPASLVLAACCIVVMETAEAQGDILAALVERDPLTGVGNRRLLGATLDSEIRRHAARGDQFSLLALDLNGFKALNDQAGHAAGDELLRQVAGVLVAASGKHDVVVRQGGDEFCVILPHHDERAAHGVAERIRRGLADIDTFGDVSSGVGTAVFPRDGRGADALLSVADDRLRAEKDLLYSGADRRRSEVTGGRIAPHSASAAELDDLSLDAHRAASKGVTRAELAVNPIVWRLNGWVYLLYAAIGTGVCLLAPSLATPAFPYVVGFGTLVGLALLLSPCPPVGSWRNHLVISMSYIVPALCLVTCQPGGSVAIGSAIFVGPLAAVRLASRWQTAAHVGAASLVFVALVPTGAVNAATTLAILLLVVASCVLAFVVVLVLEAVEAQSRQLASLAVHDPLTGVANRRGLDEFLSRLAADEQAARRSLAAVALDLNGFKALNDELGHSAGDDLLRSTAAALTAVSGPQDLVVRLGGDEFCLVLPGASSREAEDRVGRAKEALSKISCNGAPLTSGYGIASCHSAASSGDLLHEADLNLLANKSMQRLRSHADGGRGKVREPSPGERVAR